MHFSKCMQENSWLNSKAQKADSIYVASVKSGSNQTSAINNTTAPGLQQEIDDYTATHKNNYDSVSADNNVVTDYPEGNGNNGNTNNAVGSSVLRCAPPRARRHTGDRQVPDRHRRRPSHPSGRRRVRRRTGCCWPSPCMPARRRSDTPEPPTGTRLPLLKQHVTGYSGAR